RISETSINPGDRTGGSPSCLRSPLLPQHRLHSLQIPANLADLFGHFELPHRFLDSQPKELVGQVALFCAELVGRQVAQRGGFHSILSCAKRVANFVRIGSFEAASFNASRASFSDTPSISKSTR